MAIEIQFELPDFGKWVREHLDNAGVKLHRLAVATELADPYLSRLINSGKNGRPIQPDPENVQIIVEGLQKLGFQVSAEEGFVEAGYKVAGYVCVPESRLTSSDRTAALRDNYSPEERAIIEQIRAMSAGTPPTAKTPAPTPVDEEYDPHALPPPGYTVGGRLPVLKFPESMRGTGPAPSTEEPKKGAR